jgi:hypothetical protein
MEPIMTLSVRLPPRVEQELAEYCVEHHETKSALVQDLIERFLAERQAGARTAVLDHPFVGHDAGDGEDVSGTIKARLRARFPAGESD